MFSMMASANLAQLNHMATKAKIEISLKYISLATSQYIIWCAKTEVSDPGAEGSLVS